MTALKLNELNLNQRRALEGLIFWCFEYRSAQLRQDAELIEEAKARLNDYGPELDRLGVSWQIQNAAAGFGAVVDLRVVYMSQFFNCRTVADLEAVKTVYSWQP